PRLLREFQSTPSSRLNGPCNQFPKSSVVVEYCKTRFGRPVGAGHPPGNRLHIFACGRSHPRCSEHCLTSRNRCDFLSETTFLPSLSERRDKPGDVRWAGPGNRSKGRELSLIRHPHRKTESRKQ